MERILGVTLGILIVLALAANTILKALSYIADIVGEILIICGIPLMIAFIIWVIYKGAIAMGQAQLVNEERQLQMDRLRIENNRMLLDNQLVEPNKILRDDIGGSIYIESVFNERLARIEANRNHTPVPTTFTYSPH